MSNGLTASSLTQISECGSDHTVSVSADSAEPTTSHDKSSAAEKIAKDTGCCLYSAITVIVVMLVSIGIVLIVTGPVLGMSIWPTASKSLDHPSIKSNSIFFTNDTQESNNNNDTEIHDYQADYDTWSDEVGNDTAEDLGDLSPEALRLGPKGSYIAYLPIPINQDDEWDEEEDYNTHSIGEGNNKGESRVLLPVVMVSDDHQDSPRRFDEHLPDDYINDSSQSQIRSSGIDYKMFGSLAPVQQRPPSGGGGGRRYGAKDDYGRTTVLGPPRTNAKRKQGGRRRPPPPQQRGPVGPSRYIRPPPKRGHRIQTRYPQQWTADSGVNSQRYVNDYRRDHAVTKRPPLYSYPREAMNIQDIINYMTSLGNSDNPSSNTHKPTTSRESWVAPPPSYSGNSRIGNNFGFNSRDSRPHHSPSDVRSKAPPYSFMLDVYPVRDSGTSASSHHHPSASIQTSAQQPTSQFSSRPGEVQYVDDYQQQQYAVTRRPYINYVDQSNLRDQHDQQPVPIAFRPTPSPPVFSNNRPAGVAHPPRDEDPSSKPKLVVHLNVYNQKNNNNNNPTSGRSQHFHTRQDDEYDPYDDYFSPTDIYRAVLRNNAAKRDQYLQAGSDSDFHHMMSQDDGLPGGQSRISSVTHQITSDLDQHDSHLIENHNLATSGPPYGTNYRSIPTPSEDYYRPSNQIRNHHQAADDVVEPLPIPLPLNGTTVEAPSTHP